MLSPAEAKGPSCSKRVSAKCCLQITPLAAGGRVEGIMSMYHIIHYGPSLPGCGYVNLNLRPEWEHANGFIFSGENISIVVIVNYFLP